MPTSAVHEAVTDKNISKHELNALRKADIVVKLV
jgi:hypothetical protein